MGILLFFGSLFGGLAGQMNLEVSDVDEQILTPVAHVSINSVSDEEYELKVYINELMEEYTETDLTEEEITTRRNEINSLVSAKALELGITLKSDLNLFQKYDVYNALVNNVEQFEELREYKATLLEEYDFSTMTYEEYLTAKSEISAAIVAKAQELGISYSDFHYGFDGKGGRRGGRGHKGRGHRGYFIDYTSPTITETETDTTTGTTSEAV